MAKVEPLEPIYDDKVKKILQLLGEGFSREEVAEQFRYSTYRSMDGYMNRKNFLWDKTRGTYVPADVLNAPLETIVSFQSDRVRRVVMELNKEGADPKETALKVGFENHIEMARYMKSKGFEWSQEAGNYISASPPTPKVAESAATVSIDGAQESSLPTENDGLEKYLPLLEWLATNKEALQSVCLPSVLAILSGQIPRFTLKGTFVTKSVHMTNPLDQMVRDFSKEKNINQREIFEVALIEFFQKYGYERETHALLETNA
ncbi:hypothetical protein SAMN00017405_0946 [Desulfonispora thiosulfatigenes DSM 11270]|uniref:Uncharacterized protein n=1 Tax=Desulfonispora thiosulfatigenes DSM 11270 TaxID=656914 RepID=A0A1W1UPJ6_DESTI|nr:hypothetical protein [Desulfonispora thiosulfatigenes]SMB82634.1 hypothetical protein SAMN00017405_0946 [Desulfonispora thiosulfatigenes DSM 11270]